MDVFVVERYLTVRLCWPDITAATSLNLDELYTRSDLSPAMETERVRAVLLAVASDPDDSVDLSLERSGHVLTADLTPLQRRLAAYVAQWSRLAPA